MLNFYSVVYLLWWCGLATVLAGRDYYKILGVSKSSSSADIKRAYRKLSLKYHPDKNSAPDAAQKFADIATAYEVLSDPEKRETYNRGGEDAVKMQEQRGGGGGGGGGMDPFDIFEQFGFGGFGGMGGRQRQQEQRTPDVEIPVRVTLAQLYVGEMLDVSYTRQVLCVEASSCQKNSNECHGPGVRVKMQQLAPGFMQQVQVQDASCVARGKAWKKPCKACPRGMTEEEEIQLTLDIKRGMTNGDKIKFEQVADEAVGHIPGDLVFKIVQTPHDLFTRQGDNLHMTLSISLLDSLVGFSQTFPHVDGHNVVVTKPTVSYCSEIVTVKGEGMPKKGKKEGDRGDLFVTLQIGFPPELSDKQKDQLKAAFA